MKTLDDTFAHFANGADTLDFYQLRCALIYVLGYKPARLTICRLTQDRETCSLAEFKEIASRLSRQSTTDPVSVQFDLLDSNKQGYLTFDDFDAACEEVAPLLSAVVRRQVFDEVDSNGDGRVTMRNFQMMLGS